VNENIKIVQEHYDANVLGEWNRITAKPEFLITCRMLDRYIKPSDKVLDIGGGPGRYAFYFAEKGSDVTLFDLSPENIKFANEKSDELNLPIKAICGDAKIVDKIIHAQFDHVLLMGPVYHLLEEADRITAVNAALNLLKPNGIIYVSFITLFAGVIELMKLWDSESAIEAIEIEYFKNIVARTGRAWNGFTKTFMMDQSEILPFMSQFPLEKLHLFGQESITSPFETHIMLQSKENADVWLDLFEKLCEREDLLSWSQHLMYVGRKI